MTNETPQFFVNRDGQRLFGVLHRVDAPADRAVVVCAPLFDEKLWSHRVFVNFARFLAARGVPALRFDYFGDGESEGRFEEASVATRVRDIHDAIDFCRRETGVSRVVLVGSGYGATLALRATLEQKHDAVSALVAWSPVIDGERYMGDILRTHLSAQMLVHRKIIHDREALIARILADGTVNIEGYEIAKPLYSQVVGANVVELLHKSATPVLVQQVGPAERVDSQYEAVAKLPRPIEFEVVQELKFWTQQKKIYAPCDALFGRAASWLTQAA